MPQPTATQPPYAERRKVRRASADVDAEVLGDTGEARGVALADRPELPFAAVAVELAEDHRGLRRGVLGEVVAGDLGLVGPIDDADERVAHLAEALAAAVGVIDRHGGDDLLDVLGHPLPVELYLPLQI